MPNVFPVFMSLFCYDSFLPSPVKLIEADLPSTVFSSSSSALSYLYCQGRNSVGLAKLDFYLLLSCFSFSLVVHLFSCAVNVLCKLASFMCLHDLCFIYDSRCSRCSYPLSSYPSTDQLILNSRRQNPN